MCVWLFACERCLRACVCEHGLSHRMLTDGCVCLSQRVCVCVECELD